MAPQVQPNRPPIVAPSASRKNARDKFAILDARARDIEVNGGDPRGRERPRPGLVFDPDVHGDRMGYFADRSKPTGLRKSLWACAEAGINCSCASIVGVAAGTHCRPQ